MLPARPFTPKLRPLVLVAASAALAGTAGAQQFTYQASLPGGFVWTEGVEAADVDQDGDQDLFLANGDGLYSPGTKRQAGLVINQLELGPGQFAEEGLARLGNHVSHAKNVNTADVDGDGWVDALYSNAFATDPPFLFINRGAAQPGFFDEQGATRGLTALFSSAGASFGDVDNDGDLDFVIGDTGPVFNAAPGGRPHLFINDGSGVFTEDAAGLNAPIKIGHLDVDLVDIDLDWDLDLYGTNRGNSPGGIHHLLLNDGAGNFSDASALTPATSGNVYESDLADLDGDTDLDIFFLSLVGFSDGPARNNTVENGALSFTKAPQIGGDDDNEVAFIDYDMDADLDVVIGSLGAREKLIRNNGGGSFTQLTSEITNISDKTLDVAVVDIDNDADYDLITVQGESSSSSWDNKIYLNNGPADTLAPVIQRLEALVGAGPAGPWVVRAQVMDQVHDDGKNWVTGQVSYRVDVGAFQGATTAGKVLQSSGSIYRFEMTDTAAGLGTRLVYEITFTDIAGNSSSSGQIIVPLQPCGFSAYGSGTAAHTMTLTGVNDGTLGQNVDLITTGAPGDLVFTGLSLAAGNLPLGGGVVLIDLASLVAVQPIATIPGGSALWILVIPDDPVLAGLRFHFQSIAADAGQPGGLAFSDGLELIACE
ncbi:FG-GAP repeat domain-containing protein [Engelhardtia mirabilis]|uniref:FG-GAP repeat protein n=1 Tax=Engelhardtia mirabilis TaxID=2528011 RepID=A0A518BJU2_9BACT|nr:FG-GAP repeat protein [Planctomycetes bacterium Pla133]QDV01576.1 FG-GAP repeat protein [Planctomycetes bacterium Pla86]